VFVDAATRTNPSPRRIGRNAGFGGEYVFHFEAAAELSTTVWRTQASRVECLGSEAQYVAVKICPNPAEGTAAAVLLQFVRDAAHAAGY